MPAPCPPIVFATVDHRAQHGRAFGIQPVDLQKHMLVLGRTGAGKSVLLEHLVLGLIERGEGITLIDPHGDLAESVLAKIPPRRFNDVIWFDPADRAHVIGLNVLAPNQPITNALIVAGVLSVFRRLFAASWGPRTEHVLRNLLFAELSTVSPSLSGCLRVLVDEAHRVRVVERVRDPIVKQFWQHEFRGYSASFRAEVVAPIQNKLGALMTDPAIRAVVDARSSRLSFRSVMDEGRVCIANLAKGRLGEDASTVLGALITLRLQFAAYSRAGSAPHMRRSHTLFADEFQTYATDSFGEVLAEGRKFGFSSVLATQSIGALNPNFRRVVLGNVGSLLSFRIGAEDAELLAPEFAPDLTAHNLANLGQHQLALKLSIDGATSAPFTACSLPPPPVRSEAVADTIRRISSERYGSRP